MKNSCILNWSNSSRIPEILIIILFLGPSITLPVLLLWEKYVFLSIFICVLQTIERGLKCLESLLYYVAQLSLRMPQSQIALWSCCIPKQTCFFQWWKAIYGFFHCSRSPSENGTWKSNLIVCNQRRYILKINWAVQEPAAMTAPHGQYAEKWQCLWEHSPSNEWSTQLEHDVGTWASMGQCLPLGVQQGVLLGLLFQCCFTFSPE